MDAELRGTSLYSSVDREFIAVGAEFLRDDVYMPLIVILVLMSFQLSFNTFSILLTKSMNSLVR